MLKPALQLRLGQQLTMTPQLQQAIRLLQLPVLELQAQIREALETNVMLESEDEAGSLETGDTVVEPQFEITAPAQSAETVETGQEADTTDDSDWGDSPVTGQSDSPWSGEDHSQDFSDTSGETLPGTSDLATGDVAAQRTRHAYRRSDHRCHQRRRLRH